MNALLKLPLQALYEQFFQSTMSKIDTKEGLHIINNKGPLSNLEGSLLSWNY